MPTTAVPMFRDSSGRPVSAKAIRSDSAALDKKFYFSPLRPDPTEPHVIGTIDGVPVIHCVDLGESPYTDALREVAFMLPGDSRVHHGLLDSDCTIPQHRSGTWRARRNSPLYRSGYYLVLNVTDETWGTMDEPGGR